MINYITSYENDNIANAHRTIIYLPFHYRCALDRLLHSLYCMFLKKDKHYIDKLRIIQLIEADFNAILKILLIHRLMRYADTIWVNSTQIHGERQCRSTYDDMIISQPSNDITRLNHSNLLITSNDADGCYQDRRRPAVHDCHTLTGMPKFSGLTPLPHHHPHGSHNSHRTRNICIGNY